MNQNILILSAGRRVELAQAFMAEITRRGMDAKVMATELKPELSAACQVVDEWVRAPRVNDPVYADFLLSQCYERKIGLVVPTIDTELLLLAEQRARFEQEGIHIVVSDASLVKICRDKRLTANLFNDIGIDTPAIYSKNAIQFPCFAKPYDGSCSIGASIIQSREGLSDGLLADPKMMFMELIDGSYQEFTVDAYYDRLGGLKCYVPRQRIETRGGEVSKGVTRKSDVYAFLHKPLSAIKGARGCLTIQVFYQPVTQRFAALEINPRFGGGYPLSYSSGANYPGWLIDEYFSGKKIDFFSDWESDLLMLRYDAKVLIHHYDT